MSTNINPWELGSKVQGITIPSLCVGNFTCVRIAPPKKSGNPRDGMVATFLMNSYLDAEGKLVETITTNESAEGYKIEFPNGKKNLLATKFRGPQNKFHPKFKHPVTGELHVLPQERFTVEGAVDSIKQKIAFDKLSKAEQDLHIDEYFEDLFLFELSQDLMLPEKDGNFEKPFVGLTTKLYRVYTPPVKDAKWGNTIITKWHKPLEDLTGDFSKIPEDLAVAMLTEYQQTDIKFKENFEADDDVF